MKSKERIDTITPTTIIQLYLFPYIYFSEKFGRKNRTLLDCACGSLYQERILLDRFSKVSFIDKEILSRRNYFKIDLEKEDLPFLNNEFDISFSFETIEHLSKDRQEHFVDELWRVTNSTFVIGSVSKDGPNYIGKDLIFKKSLDCNLYHQHEFSSWEWEKFFKDRYRGCRFYHSVLTKDFGLAILEGLDGKNGYCNYAVLMKE